MMIDEKDPYYMAYNILTTALKDENIDDGVIESLHIMKECFNADNVNLYKLNENGDYVQKFNQIENDEKETITTSILNTAKGLLENRKNYQISTNYDVLKNVLFIPITVGETKYVVSVTGKNNLENTTNPFMNIFTETMSTILSKLEMITKLSKMAQIDALTGLENRTVYENAISEENLKDGMIYGLFDLFRLKSINDNYSHSMGDEYIRQTAEVLKKYFPKYIYTKDSNGKISKEKTGTSLYRVGGDEYVLISTSESYESVLTKLTIIQDEIRNLGLDVQDPIGLNYGVVVRENGESFRDMYLEADKLLSQNKRDTYIALGLDRRR